MRELCGGPCMNAHTHAHGAHDHHDHGHGHHHHDHGAHHDHHHHAHAGTLPGRADVLLTARDIHFARAGRTILEGIDLDLAPGEIVTLIGPNGAGKTTLVRILLGLERPDRGTITRRAGLSVGYAPQRFDRDPAIPMTVARFLALGSRHTPAEAETALQEVGAARVIGQQLSQLSGGELQRVAIARAIAKRPSVLLCDEPTGALDLATGVVVLEAIARVNAELGTTTIVITHNASIASMADVVIRLADGQVAETTRNTTKRQPRELEW